jgi:hypothetical protein
MWYCFSSYHPPTVVMANTSEKPRDKPQEKPKCFAGGRFPNTTQSNELYHSKFIIKQKIQ